MNAMRHLAPLLSLSLAMSLCSAGLQAQQTPSDSQVAQLALVGLQEGAKTSFERLQSLWTRLIAVGKEHTDASEAERFAIQSRVDSIRTRVLDESTHLKALVVSLEERGEVCDAERDLLFTVLGDAGAKPVAAKTLEELQVEAKAMDPIELRKRMAVQFSLYKATVSRAASADAVLEGASTQISRQLQVFVAALQAGGDTGADIADVESYLLEQEGLSLEAADPSKLLMMVSGWGDSAWDWLVVNGPGALFSVLKFAFIVFAFKILAGILSRLVAKALSSNKLNLSALLRAFAVKSTRNLVLIIGLLVAVSSAGFNMGPLLAMIAAAGLVVGLALQGTLSNFASGLMLLIYRPFDVGDVVDAGGVTGKVEALTLVSTTLLTSDNKFMVVPNNSIWGNTITNMTARSERRVDLTFGIGYSDDIPFAEKILSEVVCGHDKVLANPEPNIRVGNLGDSSVDFIVRPWCKTEDYWDVYWDLTRDIKMRFDREGISIPFPQRDVHMIQPPIASEASSVRRDPSIAIPPVPPKTKSPSGLIAGEDAEASAGETGASS